MPTVRRKIFGPRTVGITTFLDRIAIANGIKVEDIKCKKQFLRETVSYTATGDDEALARFISEIDKAVKEYNAD